MRVRLNLVDFYKVSLASLAMKFFCWRRVFFILLLAALTEAAEVEYRVKFI